MLWVSSANQLINNEAYKAPLSFIISEGNESTERQRVIAVGSSLECNRFIHLNRSKKSTGGQLGFCSSRILDIFFQSRTTSYVMGSSIAAKPAYNLSLGEIAREMTRLYLMAEEHFDRNVSLAMLTEFGPVFDHESVVVELASINEDRRD